MNKLEAFLWSIFGNDDDPLPPSWYHPTWPLWLRTALWYVRNPLHNLFSYRWGLGHIPFSRFGIFPTDIYARPPYRLNFTVCRTEAGREYPFVSYRGRWVTFYIGWRPVRGGLGAALRFGKSKG